MSLDRRPLAIGAALLLAGVVAGAMLIAGLPKWKGRAPTESVGPTHAGAASQDADQRKAPRIMFEQTAMDFGRRLEGDELTFRFPFRNEGSAVLIIENIKVSCRCTSAAAASNEVRPGDVGHVDVRLSSAPGPVVARIMVLTNTVAGAHELTVGGIIEPMLALSPSVIDFGEVRIGQAVTRPFSIRNVPHAKTSGDTPLGLQFQPSCPELAVRSLGASTVAQDLAARGGGGIIEAELTVRPGLEQGERFGSVLVRVPNEKTPLSRRLEVTWTVVGNLRVKPQSGFFCVVRDGREATATVELISQGDKPFEIKQVECDSDRLQVGVETMATGRHYCVTASLVQQWPREPVRGAVTIHTTDEAQAVIRLPARFLFLDGG